MPIARVRKIPLKIYLETLIPCFAGQGKVMINPNFGGQNFEYAVSYANALTSDMVWLVQQTVTLPDGSQQAVLVPQVYVRVRPGDLDGSGALTSCRPGPYRDCRT